jgi:hypothetical protein
VSCRPVLRQLSEFAQKRPTVDMTVLAYANRGQR